MRYLNSALSIVLCLSIYLHSEEIRLDDIEIRSVESEPGTVILTQETSRKNRAVTLQDRLSRDPVFSVIPDNKGEEALSFRGMGFRATELYEDDIPLYRTANGFVDAKFIMTNAALVINDGSGSGILGVSAPGGEIYISTTLPQTRFESNIYATLSSNDLFAYTSTGSFKNGIYFQAEIGYYDRWSYRISDDYTLTEIQPKRERINSDKHQKNLSFRSGIQINEAFHLAAKISLTRSEFGIPPNTHTDPATPVWNAYSRITEKQLDSFYLYGDYNIDDISLILRLYHDDYEDIYDIYNDPAYLHKTPSTLYNDRRTGAIFKAIIDYGKHHDTYSMRLESNRHRRSGGEMPIANYRADTLRLGYTHLWDITPALHTEASVSYTVIASKQASEQSALTPPNDKKGFDAQLKVSYEKDSWLWYGSIAQKHRMPAMVEMFTFFPWVIPNPKLKPEKSLQYTVGSHCTLSSHTTMDVVGYYYDISDLIIKNAYHYTNREYATNYGLELRVQNHALSHHDLQLSYAYSHTRDSRGDSIALIPSHKIQLQDTVKITPDLHGYLSYTYVGTRSSLNSATYSDTHYTLDPYHLVDIQLSYRWAHAMTGRVGIRNLLDESYEWEYGYPTPGREYYLSFEWHY